MMGAVEEESVGSVAGVGYEGRSVADVTDLIKDAGVTVLVDVRLNAISRKPGLSKRRLAERLSEVGIRYEHMPALGNPKDNRAGFRNGEAEARGRYAAILSGGSSPYVDQLVEITSCETVALLCVERDAGECHRSAVMAEMKRRQPSITVRDL
jgi:uncharacterized protein (DUF488 family)